MTFFMSVVILCGFAVLQSYAQDVRTMQVDLLDRSNESSDESKMKVSRPAISVANSMPEQYEIISLCTNIPSIYNDIIDMYVSSEGVGRAQDIKKRTDYLKSQYEQLLKYVDTYTAALKQPETYPVREQMISSGDALIQATEKLRTNLLNEPQLDMAGKLAFASSDIRSALVDFQTACLAQTRDIVNNVLADLRDNSNNTD